MTPRLIPIYPGRSRQTGFTLAELLIASVLGVFIIAGAASVFTANRETARSGELVQTNQEALRYVAQTISRVVRAGEDFSGTNVTKLVVNFSGDLPEDVRDCLGNPASGGSNSFTTALNADTGKYELLCQRDTEEPQALVDGLAPVLDKKPNFRVQLLQPNLNNDHLGELQNAANFDDATSVEVALRMMGSEGAPEINENVFVVTMRCAVLGCSN